MAPDSVAPGSRSEHRGLTYWMERVLKLLDRGRVSPDPDTVHDLRVAIRRCRSVAAFMEEVDAEPAWREMRKLGRKLFRQLGELRDTQVLEDWAKKLAEEGDPVRRGVLAMLERREAELRHVTLKAAAKFDQKAWRKLERGLGRRVRLVPADSPAAESLALERLESARALHSAALRSEKPEAWHELRIGVKRLRYAVESLLPARYKAWSEDLKRLQDLLGEVHDLDVLSATTAEAGGEAPNEVRAAWAERIASERLQRIETYRQLTLGKASLWHAWRQALPHGEKVEEATKARLAVTARALDANPRRTTQVTRMALRLYDGLARMPATAVFALEETRRVLEEAARLHGIGAGLDRKSPQKAARVYLEKLAVPTGWTQDNWELLASVVRYYRGALPQPKHKSFAKLPEERQRAVAGLAGVLRLARALRKCGVDSVVGLRLENATDAVIVHVPGLQASEKTAARMAAGKYLLESHLGKPLIVKAEPPHVKVLELPQKEEPPDVTAAASD